MGCIVQKPKLLADGQESKVATLDDVARHAGVSTATVSRVLNGLAGAGAATAERVLASCAALHYQPNGTARVLAGGRSKTLGLWVPDIRNHFFMEIVGGVLEAVQEHGYLVTLSSYTGDPVDRQYKYTAELLAAAPLAGAVVVGSRDRDPAIELLGRRGIPLVAVDHPAFDDTCDSVNIDNIGAAHEAVTHLIDRGYRRIGLIAGSGGSMTGRDRLAGYRQALRDAGIAHDPALEFRAQYSKETGHRGAFHLLDLTPPIDALVTAGNAMSLGALGALHERGRRVPDDLAMVGFDELPWETPGTPSLTSIVQPTFALGNTAATQLIGRLEHPERHVRRQIVLQHRLRIGDTSPYKETDTHQV